MVRSEKVIIFNGPKEEFNKYIPEYYIQNGNNYSLTQLVNLSESERKTFLFKIEGYEPNREV